MCIYLHTSFCYGLKYTKNIALNNNNINNNNNNNKKKKSLKKLKRNNKCKQLTTYYMPSHII